jgi:SpoIID/LytB domain protein
MFAKTATLRFDLAARQQRFYLACALSTILCFGLALRADWSRAPGLTGPNPATEDQIDETLQAAANTALGQREGVIIVMDPQTGRIRALVNPRIAFAEATTPGSAIKPFTALAAMRSGVIDRDSRTVCRERYTNHNFSTVCSHPPELPPLDPAQAIAYSCNYYFGTLGERLRQDSLEGTLRTFGFGSLTGINAEREFSGTLRPCESTSRVSETSLAECKGRYALGQTDNLQTTPIQLITAYAALLNGGNLLRPQIAASSRFVPRERSRIEIAPSQRNVIVEGMIGAVRYGTAKNAGLDEFPFEVLGKTGTSTPIKGFRTQGWFVGFASVAPVRADSSSQNQNDEAASTSIKLVVLVFMPHSHGAEAAAVSKPIFEAYADAVGHRNTETQRSEPTTNQSGANNSSSAPVPLSVSIVPASPRLPVSPSPNLPFSSSTVRVHLVSQNITREMPFEDYVLGVLRAEGSLETEPEALRALAVAIRTYAMKNRERHAKDGYDFCSTTHCQRFVWTGNESSDASLSDRFATAARATEGQVLIDDHGRLAEAFFGASCGGATANIGTLWGTNAPAYLRGVPDEYCATGLHANWTDVISGPDLLRALQSDARTNIGVRLDNILISKHDETGRAETITLEGERQKTVRGWDFKIIVGRALGWNVLKSSRFDVSRSGSDYIFHGSGFGHGLGLCQEGAHVMAQRGATYHQILAKYFPGTSVRRNDVALVIPTRAPRLQPRSGKMSLARSFKAGNGDRVTNDVASATIESSFPQPSRSRGAGWHADMLLAKKGSLKSTRTTNRPQPPSGAMFIATTTSIASQLRRNVMFRSTDSNQRSHHAPTELNSLFATPVYKHSAPPGLAANQNRLTISSEHFRVTYPANTDRRDADLVLNTLETARNDFLRRVAAASIPVGAIRTLEININNSTGDFVGRTGQPWWAAAATHNSHIELQPVGLLKRRGVLETTLRHELAHVVIDAVSHEHAPRWLGEGFAIYLAGEGPLISRYAPKAKLTTAELEQKLEHPSSQPEMRALYAAAYSKVAELNMQEGEARVWRLLAGNKL